MTPSEGKPSSQKKIRYLPSRYSPIITGCIAGLFAASVLYSKSFPAWVPIILSQYPVIFFGSFIVLCGVLGYIWALADDWDPESRKHQKPKLLNSILTGIICGVFGAAVLYSKALPKWVPSILSESPALFFGLFVGICGLLGYIWTLPDNQTPR